MTEDTKKPRSLADFVKDKRRADCSICALPDATRADVHNAGKRDIKRAVVIEWLEEDHGTKVMRSDLDRHFNGRHEER